VKDAQAALDSITRSDSIENKDFAAKLQPGLNDLKTKLIVAAAKVKGPSGEDATRSTKLPKGS
jgi:hypothetical protein